jgi:hypothetical protein
MRIYDLFETPEQDLVNLRIAQRASGKFSSYLRQNNEKRGGGGKTLENLGFFLANLGKLGVAWVIPATKVGIDDEHLYLCISQRNQVEKSNALLL